MDALVLIAAWIFYLFAGYSAAILGFFDALLTLARPRLGAAIYWSTRFLEVGAICWLIRWDHAWAIGYALGFSAGWAYRPSYADGSERTGARSWRWFRRLRVWRLLHWWVDFRPSPEVSEFIAPHLFAVHPHGFIPIGVMLQFMLPGRQGNMIRPLARPLLDPLVATTSILFWIPIAREFCLWIGCVVADREAMVATLETRSLVVMPGGVGEMVAHDHDRLAMKFEHFGFLEVAIQANVDVVPMFSQGENRAWIVLPGSRAFRRLAARFIGWPFPTLPVPFLFPVEMRMRASSVSPRIGTRERFVRDMRDLVVAHECLEDIDLSCFDVDKIAR